MHRGCFVWTPSPPLAGRRTPRPGPVRVCVCLLFSAGSGRPAYRERSGAPHLFLWPLCLSALLGPLRAGVALVLVLCFCFFFRCFFLRPLCLLLSLVFGPGCPGSWCFVLFVLLASRFLGVRAFLLSLCCLAVCCSPVVAPPPSLLLLLPFLVALRSFFHSFSSSLRLPCLRLSVFSGPESLRPWRWFVFVPLGSPCSVFFFAPPPSVLRAFSPVLCLPVGRWLFPAFCSHPPSPSVSRGFCRWFLFFSLCVPPLSPAFSGFWPRTPWALALCFVCFFRPPAARLSVRSRLVCVSRLALGCSLVVAAPPPPSLLCLAVFVAPAGCLGVFYCLLCAPPLSPAFSSFRPRPPWASALCVVCLVGLPLPGSFVLSAWPLAVPWWLLPPPPFVSRGFRPCRSVLCAVCCAVLCVPGCGVAPRCCALCRPVLCCRVLCCFVALVWCRCAVPSGASRRPGALCSAALCFVPPRCVLCAVCVLSWCGGACCCSPLCFVLCVSQGAVLCVPCILRSVWCCASLCRCACVVLLVWCVLLLAPDAVVRCCVLPCFLWCAVVRCWVWWPVVVCWWRVSVAASLSGRVVCFPVVGVFCCGALLSCVVFCGALLSRGAVLFGFAVLLRCCWGLLCPPVACRAVLCCAVGWLCCFLPGGGICVMWCSFPRAVRSLFSLLCALRCLVALAVVPCFPVSCAVALCCRVMLCCRALLSFCGAVCVCFALLRPVVRRRAVLCCAVGCLCRFLSGGGVCVLWGPFPPCRHAQKTSIILHVTPRWWRCRGWHVLVVAVSWT